jgi:hypothetical protein
VDKAAPGIHAGVALLGELNQRFLRKMVVGSVPLENHFLILNAV